MSIKDLKSMVMAFRVAELQNFLEFAGERHHRLRKKELQKKAIKLLSNRRMANKIKTIYKDMMGKSSDEDNFPSDLEDCYSDFNYFGENQFPTYDYLSGCGNNLSNNFYMPSSQSEEQYFAMFTKNLDMKRLSNVQFSNLTFYEYKNDILPITPLIPKKQEDDIFTFDKTFTLNQETTNAIFSKNSHYQALLRFCVLNNEMSVCDQLPTMLSVKINHYVCTLPPLLSVGSKQNACKRSAPVNITSNLEKNKYINSLSIQWSVDYYTLFGVVVQLMRKNTSEELITKLKEKGERDPSISKKFIYDNLNDDDNEICATSLKMSLICPIGKMPITLPTRATTCNHLQCFDGCSYIQINELKSTWICPVCSQTCLYENLFIDGYFTEILRSDKFLPNIRDVELDPDGSWRPVIPSEPKKRPVRTSVVIHDNITQEKPTVETECSPIRKDDVDILDNLRDFFYHYNNPTAASSISLQECSARLPTFPELRENKFEDVANVGEYSNCNRQDPKKNVILVDLTLSDSESESDDIKSVSSESYSSSSVSWRSRGSLKSYHLGSSSSSSPLVYDIDSDGSTF